MGQEETEIWSSMLKSASTANTTPRGTLLLLGTNRQLQSSVLRRLDSRATPANEFGLGYAYIDFVDREHADDCVAHLDAYTLDDNRGDSAEHGGYTTKLVHKVVNNSSNNKNLLACVVLDWQHIKAWSRELAAWVKLVDTVVTKDPRAIDELTRRFKMYCAPGAAETQDDEFAKVEMPLEEGQFDEPLGVDLMVAVVGSEWAQEQLDQSAATSESELNEDMADFAVQFLRTVVSKHGGSIVFTPYSHDVESGQVLDLVSERLKLPVQLTNEAHQHTTPSVVDYSQFVIPAGWDTRGKILATREEDEDSAFDITKVQQLWCLSSLHKAVEYYESVLGVDEEYTAESNQENTVPKRDYQEFLAKQYEYLEAKMNEESTTTATAKPQISTGTGMDFNVGGVQVEGVEEVLRRLKAREAQQVQENQPVTPDRSARSESNTPVSPSPAGGSNNQNDMLQNFFQNLLDRRRNSPGGNNNSTNSPG